MKRVGIIILSILLLFSTISMIIVVIVYNGQFPRFNRHDTSVTADLRYEDLQQRYPRSLVRFESGKNELQGYVYGEANSLGLVVVSHGLGGGADSYLPEITYFVDQGWRVFAYDATGSFDSEGKTARGFPQSLLDLRAALTFLGKQEQFQALPVLLFGHSWGGYASAAVLDGRQEIAGVVTASAPNSPMEMILEQGERMMGGFIDSQAPFLWLYQRLLFGEAASVQVVDAINQTDVPVLILHGTADDQVSYDGSAIIAKMNRITNPNAIAIPMDEPGRNGHNNLFRSAASAEYVDEINMAYRALYDQHDHNIPYDIKQAFYADIDRDLVQELNPELMGRIHAFYLACAGAQ